MIISPAGSDGFMRACTQLRCYRRLCRVKPKPAKPRPNRAAVIRVCITNHRTRKADLEALIVAMRKIGDELITVGLLK